MVAPSPRPGRAGPGSDDHDPRPLLRLPAHHSSRTRTPAPPLDNDETAGAPVVTRGGILQQETGLQALKLGGTMPPRALER